MPKTQPSEVKVSIPCPHCDGSGRKILTGVYLETLSLLRRQTRPISGADLARLAGCRGEAMCNRLIRLEGLGLAESTEYGRKRLWRAKP